MSIRNTFREKNHFTFNDKLLGNSIAKYFKFLMSIQKCSNIDKKSFVRSSSCESIVEPLQFYLTNHTESFNKAAALRAWHWMDYRLGDKYVKISMNPRTSFIKKLQDYTNNYKYLSSSQLVKEDLSKIH